MEGETGGQGLSQPLKQPPFGNSAVIQPQVSDLPMHLLHCRTIYTGLVSSKTLSLGRLVSWRRGQLLGLGPRERPQSGVYGMEQILYYDSIFGIIDHNGCA